MTERNLDYGIIYISFRPGLLRLCGKGSDCPFRFQSGTWHYRFSFPQENDTTVSPKRNGGGRSFERQFFFQCFFFSERERQVFISERERQVFILFSLLSVCSLGRPSVEVSTQCVMKLDFLPYIPKNTEKHKLTCSTTIWQGGDTLPAWRVKCVFVVPSTF